MPTEDAAAIAELVRLGKVSAVEVVADAIARAERANPAVNAIVHERYERALAEAAAITGGPLAGVPILVKDTAVTIAGEPHHEGLQVAKDAGHRSASTSWLVDRLRSAGCVVLGRTNVPELCTHGTTEPMAYGPTRNPWSLEHSAGGSSGGSGAAVAAGIVPLAHGSDGGGSVRAPAGFCGLVGLKPTTGRVRGEHWDGLSSDGFLTTTVRDTAVVLDVVNGSSLRRSLDAPLPPLRIGVRTRGACGGGPAHAEVDDVVRRVAALLEAAGHQVEDASPTALDEEEAMGHQRAVVGACVAAELDIWSRRLRRPIGLDELEPRNAATIAAARQLAAPEYVAALTWLQGWTDRLTSWFDGYDLLLTPVITGPTPRLGEMPAHPTPEQAVEMRKLLGWLLGAWNVTGQPAITVPGGRSADGLPIGVQLVAGRGREDLLVQAAQLVEQVQPWTRVAPG